jgi:hypothetical protein
LVLIGAGFFETTMEETDLMNNPKLFGHGCVLSAFGKGFEPKLFLEQTTFPPAVIAGFGGIGMPAEAIRQAAEKLDKETVAQFFEAKYLALKISGSESGAAQHAAAAEFLRRHRAEVLRLSQFPNVEQVNLRCALPPGAALDNRQYEELIELAETCGLTGIM